MKKKRFIKQMQTSNKKLTNKNKLQTPRSKQSKRINKR